MPVGVIEVSVATIDAQRIIKVPAGSIAEDVIRALGLNVSAQIVLRGKTPIPVDEPVVDGDQLRIIETFSGG